MPTEQGKPFSQREAYWSGDILCSRERAATQRAHPAAGGGGGRQEQNQPGDVNAGGTGEAEEGAECNSAGEENHRGLGADLQGRDGEGKAGPRTDGVVSTVESYAPPSVSTFMCFLFYPSRPSLVSERCSPHISHFTCVFRSSSFFSVLY